MDVIKDFAIRLSRVVQVVQCNHRVLIKEKMGVGEEGALELINVCG